MLLGESDWSRCTGVDTRQLAPPVPDTASPPGEDVSPTLFWDSTRQELMLHPQRFEFVSSPFDTRPTLANRRGAGCDRFGNWYWIDETERNILVNSSGSQTTSLFWTPSEAPDADRKNDEAGFRSATQHIPGASLTMQGLAVTDDHYLVVGTTAPAGLLIFDLYGGGSPHRSVWPGSFAPFDMAPRPGGGVVILDRDNRRVWVLNRDLTVRGSEPVTAEGDQEESFQPLGSGSRRLKSKTFPPGISLQEGAPHVEIDPIAIEVLADGSVLILYRFGRENFSRIRRYALTGERIGLADLAADGSGADSPGVAGHDFAFVPDQSGTSGRLYVADTGGNHALVFSLTSTDTAFTITESGEYLPMRLFGGKGLVRSGAQVFYDFSTGWIPLVRQNRPRYQESGTMFTRTLDSRETDCVWHRFLLDAVIPCETGVKIWSRTSNQEDELTTMLWQEEPVPYRRGNGPEVPFVRPAAGVDTWESLFQSAHGRYLQLKITLTGNGRATPRLRALRVYYPRFSYLEQYLPAVYRDDSLSASFLDRFLANLEGMYTALEERIANAQILFDPRCAPPEMLDWLSGWFGISLDPSWDERRQRLFIRHAMDFFNCRGTIRGLQLALQLALDECIDETIFSDRSLKSIQQCPIRIVEQFRTRRTPGIIFGDTANAKFGPGLVTPLGRWTPELTGEELCRRYAVFLASRTTTGVTAKQYPITKPVAAEDEALWQQFSRETIGFVPSADSQALQLWRDFLARRYRTVTGFNRQYTTTYTSFAAVPIPETLPEDGAPLRDWYQFESVVLPMRCTAHQFKVLLPTPKSGTADTAEYQRRLQLARRIIEMEKPAHTTFSVNFYWAMFRVGEARVGYDTVVDQGSRAPEFMAAMVLGRQHLGESLIGSLLPQPQDRYTLGETELN
jgi:phage tail-like protein